MKYLSEVFKRNGVSAKVVAMAKNAYTGDLIATLELEYWRGILAEFNTHRLFSRNSASSRAIPIQKIIDQVMDDPMIPVKFGKNQAGMQAGEEIDTPIELPFSIVLNSEELQGVLSDESTPFSFIANLHEKLRQELCYTLLSPEEYWRCTAQINALIAKKFAEAGYAKEVVNRILEPYQKMKTVMTTTDLANFLWLREHPAADPNINELAEAIHEAVELAKPFAKVLRDGEWHTPYWGDGFFDEECLRKGFKLDEALMTSASCSAQVSFRTLDDSLEKAERVFDRLNLDKEVLEDPAHASPVEHQAKVIKLWSDNTFDYEGVTHVNRDGSFGSGNFRNFIQFRQLTKNESVRGWVDEV